MNPQGFFLMVKTVDEFEVESYSMSIVFMEKALSRFAAVE